MNTAYINGEFMPLEDAGISPMDRGFLFGDGIYEVMRSHHGHIVGFDLHIARLQASMKETGIPHKWSHQDWHQLCIDLCRKNGDGNCYIYIQITRGTYKTRQHGSPAQISPTLFAYTFECPQPIAPSVERTKGFHCNTGPDRRWQRCHIKSTSVLGNVMHVDEAISENYDEIILFNEQNEFTECGACNVFIVRGEEIATPEADHQILNGITRQLLIQALADQGTAVNERAILVDELNDADEVWVCSTTKQLCPVISINGQPVGEGVIGPVWEKAAALLYQAENSEQ